MSASDKSETSSYNYDGNVVSRTSDRGISAASSAITSVSTNVLQRKMFHLPVSMLIFCRAISFPCQQLWFSFPWISRVFRYQLKLPPLLRAQLWCRLMRFYAGLSMPLILSQILVVDMAALGAQPYSTGREITAAVPIHFCIVFFSSFQKALCKLMVCVFFF